MGTPEHFRRRSHPLAILLLPFSLLFYLLSALRRLAYRIGLKQVHRFKVPVVVVGNITVGGSGKTPLVIWLCNHLREQGYRPGVVMRGYGGRAKEWPQPVSAESDPHIVGDEAVVIASGTGSPLAVSPNRVEAVQSLLDDGDCDLVISDDGLQHYALGRDLEVVVVDGERQLGNGFLLPAGPLREGRWRLDKADLVVFNGCNSIQKQQKEREYCMRFSPGDLVNLVTDRRMPVREMNGRTVHAVAGLGNPERFFNMLEEKGIDTIQAGFPDHYAYTRADISFDDDLPVIMTEKDAVKCRAFAARNMWYLELRVEPESSFTEAVTQRIEEIKLGQKTA